MHTLHKLCGAARIRNNAYELEQLGLNERALDDAAVKARRDGSNAEESESGGRLKKRRLKREIRADIEKLADGLAMARASSDVRRNVANRDATANGDAPPSADDRFTALARIATIHPRPSFSDSLDS